MSFPALDVNVNVRRPACILDAELMLTRLGPLLASRLPQELNVWLVREVLEILDNSEFYVRNPHLLVAAGRTAKAVTPLRGGVFRERAEALKSWEAAKS